MCLYFYFHLYLLKLWESLAGLPAIFPDGKRLDERAYPWLLNGLVRRHFKRLKTGRPFTSHIAEWITILLAWWVVPFTMMAFWLRFIPRHDWWGTCFHIGLIVIAVSFAIFFYRLCALTLQGKEKIGFRLQKFWKERRLYYGVSVAMVCCIFLLLSYGSIEGVRPTYFSGVDREINFYSIKEIVPWVFKKISYDVFADFREREVSEKPSNYGEIDKQERLEFVKGANLKEADLKNADMRGAFLVKAVLRDAILNGANLYGANLKQADLRSANLQQADLRNTNLQEAILWNANLQQAYLEFAHLQKAILVDANLQEADFGESDLSTFKDNLQNASLASADLTDVKNLLIDRLSKVHSLYKAKLDPDLMQQVKKCCPHLLEKPK
jgi:hypothetical protein